MGRPKKEGGIFDKPDVIIADVGDGKVKKPKAIFIKVPHPGNGQGRPFYKITEDGIRLVDRLATLNCTMMEIYAAMGVSEGTLNNRYNKKIFQETYNKGKEKYKINIRESQMRLVRKDNASMAIFLGKNVLGQTDDSKVEIMTKSPDQMSIEELYAAISKKKGQSK
ncbi:MAG: hypothetical protein EOM93_06000 [Gammaproteobacteria bacterium]|nr:hypothetical protein [Gammaproteobacteria bacterium]